MRGNEFSLTVMAFILVKNQNRFEIIKEGEYWGSFPSKWTNKTGYIYSKYMRHFKKSGIKVAKAKKIIKSPARSFINLKKFIEIEVAEL